MTAGMTALLLGVLVAGGILLLVRRDHLHGSYAIWWLAVAAGALVLGFFPRLVDWLGERFGVSYPPMLIVLVVLVALLLKLVALDIDTTRRERRVRRLLQKVSILEAELRSLRADVERRETGDVPLAPAPPARHPTPRPTSEPPRKAAG